VLTILSGMHQHTTSRLAVSRWPSYSSSSSNPATRTDLESKTWTAVREVFVPKGLQDSARGFNPGNTSPKCPALKGRQIVVIDGSFG
jgi:hypothetical protein